MQPCPGAQLGRCLPAWKTVSFTSWDEVECLHGGSPASVGPSHRGRPHRAVCSSRDSPAVLFPWPWCPTKRRPLLCDQDVGNTTHLAAFRIRFAPGDPRGESGWWALGQERGAGALQPAVTGVHCRAHAQRRPDAPVTRSPFCPHCPHGPRSGTDSRSYEPRLAEEEVGSRELGPAR